MPDKTPEEMRRELYEKMQAANPEYMTEVAMPGVALPVQPEEKDK